MLFTGDGCCWHAQHGVCHRTKNRITGLMMCPPTHRRRRAAYQRLSQLLIEFQLHRVHLSRHHVGWSRNTSESNFAQINGVDNAVELRGVASGESLPSIVAVVC